MLNYKTLGGDLLVFKNKNDCMTLSRGNDGQIDIDTISIDGEEIEASKKNNYSVAYDENIYSLLKRFYIFLNIMKKWLVHNINFYI